MNLLAHPENNCKAAIPAKKSSLQCPHSKDKYPFLPLCYGEISEE
jgi:hypothetical protein